MIKYLTKKCKQKRGFTLMEVMVVVAILAVIVMIAVPSVISMRKNMQFTQRNDYAKSIFMAAQSNLTQMRSAGQLESIIPGEDAEKHSVFTQSESDDVPSTYLYTWNENTIYFDRILPANSIDSTVRDEQIIIEYNPKAGIVYSVFYYDGNDMIIVDEYKKGKLSRDEETRKDDLHQLGYYSVGDVDALEAEALNVYQIASSISYENADEAILTITVPATVYNEKGESINLFDEVTGKESGYQNRLEVNFTVTCENGSSFSIPAKNAQILGSEGETGYVPYIFIDGNGEGGLRTYSFAFCLDSLSSGLYKTTFQQIITKVSGGDANTTGFQYGDNITITAEITFYPVNNDPIIMIESSTLAGINPLFHSLTQNPNDTADSTSDDYILAISNKRHLQNLNHLSNNVTAADSTKNIVNSIDSIVFVAQTEKNTVTESNAGTGNAGSGGTTGENSDSDGSNSENPSAQVLTLSNTDTENGGSTGEGATTPVNTEIAIDLSGIDFTPIDLSKLTYIPKIIGNGVKISNLSINTNVAGNTGLFATLNGTSIEGITLVDPVVESTATASSSGTGALIGTATDVDISNCQVTGPLEEKAPEGETAENAAETKVTPVGITGSVSVGGLVGNAVSGTTLTDCSSAILVRSNSADQYSMGGLVGSADGAKFDTCTTEAVVHGNDSVLANLGGLVGYAKASEFSNCGTDCSGTTTNGAEIQSGAQTHFNEVAYKNNLGGLVGYALEKTTFTNCSSSKDTTVLSNTNANSNLGGLVGYANDVTFTTCSSKASVNGSVKVDADGNATTAIPNNNLGGLVGYSEASSYSNTTVTLNYQPTYAEDAGGFVGVMKGGSINGLNVTINVPQTDAAEGTVTNFGAIASVCSSSVSTDGTQKITATITGTLDNAKNLGGAFYRVNNSTVKNVHINASGNLNGSTNTAGFVVLNEVGGYVYDSSVKGNFSASNAAGFVFQNYTTIERCIANVTWGSSKGSGNAFAMVNEGTITDCYGWTNTSEIANADGTYYSSYFGTTADSAKVVLYDSTGTLSKDIIYTDALASDWALELLNGESDIWERDANATYPYPHLTTFKDYIRTGPTPTGGNYSYGILYVEEYEDDSIGYYMTDQVGDLDKDMLVNNLAITGTAYYVYHRTASSTKNVGSALKYVEDEWDALGLNQLYSIYPVNEGATSVEIGNHTISLNTYYAPANSDGAYRIRTNEHFKNIGSSGNYVIERDITASSTIISFSGSITGNDHTVETTAPLFGTLTGSVTGLNVDANISAGDNAYGAIANTLDGGSITNCTVTGAITGNNAAAFVGDAQSGSFTGCSATVPNDVPFANFPTRKTAINEGAKYVSIHNHAEKSDETPPSINVSLTDTALSMAKIEETNLTLVDTKVTISKCTLNGSIVSITPVYYYSISDLKCKLADSYMEVISTKEADPTFASLVNGETTYYLHVSDENYVKITKAEIIEKAATEGETSTTTYNFHYRKEGMDEDADDIVIENIGISDKVSKYSLKLYTRTINSPAKDTYMLFDADVKNILIHNGVEYTWEPYDINYYSRMIWSYANGEFTNVYSDAKVKIGDPKSSKTYTIQYSDTSVESRLYPVYAYKTYTQVDTAYALNANLSQ